MNYIEVDTNFVLGLDFDFNYKKSLGVFTNVGYKNFYSSVGLLYSKHYLQNLESQGLHYIYV